MEYQGEHLWIGGLGHTALYASLFFLVMTFVLGLFFRKRPGIASSVKIAFILHFAAVLLATLTLGIMIFRHYFEYHYVWQYSSTDLPFTYLLSAFWAGKEGSLLIWLLFQALLGSIIIWGKRTPLNVILVISIIQLLLNLMLMGLQFGDFTLGKSPFILLREMPEYGSMPLFADPTYLNFLKEGNGLNPLLRNPWMAIHPPVLFLGYAACLIPYAWAMHAIARREVKIPVFWIVFAGFMLGAGLLLGGAWAYEDLTFGGFWSWDPVENASLVPWLLVLAALHLNLSSRYRGMGVVLSLFPYIMVIFAAWLTRSGVLSNSSAHSFSGDQGSDMLLIITVIALLAPFIAGLLRRKNSVKTIEKEEFFSQAFWMFLGAVVLIIAALHITMVTAFPAFNQWFGLALAPPVDRVGFYNDWQQWFAIFGSMLLGSVVYLRHTKGNTAKWAKSMLPAFLGAILLLVAFILINPLIQWPRYIMMFALFFAGLALLDRMLRLEKARAHYAASLAHLGFVIFLAGAAFTFTFQRALTREGAQEGAGQSMILGQIYPLNEGYASYAGRTIDGEYIRYQIDFLHQGSNGSYYLDYTLYPSVIEEPDMGPVPAPDTHKELNKDVFVFLAHAEITSDEYVRAFMATAMPGDTMVSPVGLLILDSLRYQNLPGEDLVIHASAFCHLVLPGGKQFAFVPAFQFEKGNPNYVDAISDSLGLKIQLGMPYGQDSATLSLHTRKNDYIILNARSFPWINILWLGSIMMASGFVWSLIKRSLKKNNM